MTPEENETGEAELLDRLAGDFEVLSEVVPEIHGVDDVPEAVFSLAVEQGISCMTPISASVMRRRGGLPANRRPNERPGIPPSDR